jgi:hypothetical protein
MSLASEEPSTVSSKDEKNSLYLIEEMINTHAFL